MAVSVVGVLRVQVVCGVMLLATPSLAIANVTQFGTGTTDNFYEGPVSYFHANTGALTTNSQVQGLTVSVSPDETTVTVTAKNAVLETTDTNCSVDVLQNRGTCTLPAGFQQVQLQSGADDDAITVDTSLPTLAWLGRGRDQVRLGSGDDTIYYAPDGRPDDIHGGAGTDVVNGTWSGPTSVSLDDVANDGREHSNLHSDIEDVWAESLDNNAQPTPMTLSGSAGPNRLTNVTGGQGNVLRGLGGNDTLTLDDGTKSTIDGGAGDDVVTDDWGFSNTLLGGAGQDRLDAGHSSDWSGGPDTLDCGGGVDTAAARVFDAVSNCESLTLVP